jgi:hypothetical protein
MVIRVICVYRFQIDNGPQEMLHVGRDDKSEKVRSPSCASVTPIGNNRHIQE